MSKKPQLTRNKELTRLRQVLGLTQKELAESIGYSEITVSRWELGKQPTPYHVIAELQGRINLS